MRKYTAKFYLKNLKPTIHLTLVRAHIQETFKMLLAFPLLPEMEHKSLVLMNTMLFRNRSQRSMCWKRHASLLPENWLLTYWNDYTLLKEEDIRQSYWDMTVLNHINEQHGTLTLSIVHRWHTYLGRNQQFSNFGFKTYSKGAKSRLVMET